MYPEIVASDPWFKEIQQHKEEEAKDESPKENCKCLRLDNLLKAMFRLDYLQKEEINDLVFVLCRSIKFRVMATMTLTSNLHYCQYK